MRLATTACYRACTATELADATETTTTTATTATTHATEIALRRLQRTATELADAKTTATEHYSCLIGVGACAQILISEPEREALTQKKACVTTEMHLQQHIIILYLVYNI